MRKQQYNFYYSAQHAALMQKAFNSGVMISTPVGGKEPAFPLRWFVNGKEFTYKIEVDSDFIYNCADAVLVHTGTDENCRHENRVTSEPDRFSPDFQAPELNSTWLKLFSDREDESKEL